MKIAPNQAHGRIVALGMLLLVVSLAVTSLAWPTLKLHQHYDDAIDSLSDRLFRYQRIIAIRPALEQVSEDIGKRNSLKYYWKGNTPALVAADMQSVVTRIISANNGKIYSSQTLPAKDDGKPSTGPAKVSLAVQMTASTIPLQLILHDIEANEPYLFIDQITIRSNTGRNYKPNPGVQPEFSIQLSVSGYSVAGAAPQ